MLPPRHEPPRSRRTSTTPTRTWTRSSTPSPAGPRSWRKASKWLRATSCLRRARSPTATIPTRSGTCTCPTVPAPSRSWSGPRRVLALGLGPDADDAARARPRGARPRRVEHRVPAGRAGGGGWPGTLEDAAAALDHVGALQEVDASRVVTAGHSAGGHLALWLAARGRVRPVGAVSWPSRWRASPDLARGAAANLGDGACQGLLGGGPRRCPNAMRPRLPPSCSRSACRSCSSTAGATTTSRPEQSRDYARAARAAGDEVELLELADADHFDVIEPGARGLGGSGDGSPHILGRRLVSVRLKPAHPSLC